MVFKTYDWINGDFEKGNLCNWSSYDGVEIITGTYVLYGNYACSLPNTGSYLLYDFDNTPLTDIEEFYFYKYGAIGFCPPGGPTIKVSIWVAEYPGVPYEFYHTTSGSSQWSKIDILSFLQENIDPEEFETLSLDKIEIRRTSGPNTCVIDCGCLKTFTGSLSLRVTELVFKFEEGEYSVEVVLGDP